MAGWPRNHSSHVTWLAWPWHMRTTSRKSQSLPLPLNTRKTFRMFRTKSFNLSLQDLQEGTQMTGTENDWGIGGSELSFKNKKNILGSQLPISPIFSSNFHDGSHGCHGHGHLMGIQFAAVITVQFLKGPWAAGVLAFYGWPLGILTQEWTDLFQISSNGNCHEGIIDNHSHFFFAGQTCVLDASGPLDSHHNRKHVLVPLYHNKIWLNVIWDDLEVLPSWFISMLNQIGDQKYPSRFVSSISTCCHELDQ